MRKLLLPGLLSFNGGFVDTAGFLGLQGLFTAHVTGNFVTLGAALVFGTHGVIAKVLALPEFVVVVALARLIGSALRARGADALRVLLVIKVICLLAFFVLAVGFGPFPDSDSSCASRPSLSEISKSARLRPTRSMRTMASPGHSPMLITTRGLSSLRRLSALSAISSRATGSSRPTTGTSAMLRPSRALAMSAAGLRPRPAYGAKPVTSVGCTLIIYLPTSAENPFSRSVQPGHESSRESCHG